MPDDDLYPLLEVAPGSFIYAVENALTATQCTDIINRFEANKAQHYAGRIGEGEIEADSIKRSTDLAIEGRADWQDVQVLLQASLDKAVRSLSALHPFFRNGGFHSEGINLQRTQQGEFYHWHVDYGWGQRQSQRALVALWYLNDVPGPGGCTEFEFQNISIQPVAGRLALFPPYWTHVHRNSILEQGTKYVATTWLSMDET